MQSFPLNSQNTVELTTSLPFLQHSQFAILAVIATPHIVDVSRRNWYHQDKFASNCGQYHLTLHIMKNYRYSMQNGSRQ